MKAASGALSLAYLRELLCDVHLDRSRTPLPLTIATAAGIFRGNAVDPATWLRELALQVRTLELSDHVPGTRDSIVERIERYATIQGSDAQAGADFLGYDDSTPSTIADIHLVDAYMQPIRSLPGDPQLYSAAACWQVPLDHVTAWTMSPIRGDNSSVPTMPSSS